MTVAQAFFLRRELHGFEIGRTLRAVAGMLVGRRRARARRLRGLGPARRGARRSLLAQFVSVSVALALGSAAYAAVVLALRIPEAHQIIGLIRGRMRRGAS